MIFTLFRTFLQIGLLSIGGGYAIIPLIKEQVVDIHGWLSMQEYTDIITISQMTPGPLAVNTSTFVGMRLAGVPGAVAATVGAVLFGILISLLLYRFFSKNKDSKYISQVLLGLKSASLGLIVSASVTILMLAFLGSEKRPESLESVNWIAVVIFAAGLWMLRKFKLNPMLVMVLSGAAGLLIYGFYPIPL